MAAQKLTREGCKKLDEIGEDFIFERVMAGRTSRVSKRKCKSVIGCFIHGYTAALATRDPSRWDRYKKRDVSLPIRRRGILDIADSTVDPEQVGISKLKIQTRQWLASAMNPEPRNQQSTQVNVNLGDMHIQALKDVVSASKMRYHTIATGIGCLILLARKQSEDAALDIKRKVGKL